MAHDLDDLPDWEQLLAAERHVQHLVPGAVLVGGTAAALHAGHRHSSDDDHVVGDLRGRFDVVLAALESAAGWQTERVLRAVLILGQMDGILTGIRQLERLGEAALAAALRPFDAIYSQQSGVSPLAEVVERLAAAAPADLAKVDLATYRDLLPPWNVWDHVVLRGRAWSIIVARVAMENPS